MDLFRQFFHSQKSRQLGTRSTLKFQDVFFGSFRKAFRNVSQRVDSLAKRTMIPKNICIIYKCTLSYYLKLQSELPNPQKTKSLAPILNIHQVADLSPKNILETKPPKIDNQLYTVCLNPVGVGKNLFILMKGTLVACIIYCYSVWQDPMYIYIYTYTHIYIYTQNCLRI